MKQILPITVGAVATLALCLTAWLYFQPMVPADITHAVSQPVAGYEPGGLACDPSLIIALPAAKRSEATASCTARREEHRAQQSDLEQQTRAANAGEIVAILAINQNRIALLSAILSLLATSLLVWTLWETRSSSRAELRAYVMNETTPIIHIANVPAKERKAAKHRMVVVIVIKNGGQTPAWDVRHWAEVSILPREGDNSFKLPAKLEKRSTSVIPGGGSTSKTLSPSAGFTEIDDARLKGQHDALFVWGRISYKDIFGRQRRTDYRLRYEGPWPPPVNNVMTFCDDGNEAT